MYMLEREHVSRHSRCMAASQPSACASGGVHGILTCLLPRSGRMAIEFVARRSAQQEAESQCAVLPCGVDLNLDADEAAPGLEHHARERLCDLRDSGRANCCLRLGARVQLAILHVPICETGTACGSWEDRGRADVRAVRTARGAVRALA